MVRIYKSTGRYIKTEEKGRKEETAEMAPKLMEAGGDNSTILWKALRPKKNNQEIEALKKGDKKYSRIAPDKGRNKRIHHSARDRRGRWTGHTGN